MEPTNLVILGKGNVGSALIGQLASSLGRLERNFGVSVVGVADSESALISRKGLDRQTLSGIAASGKGFASFSDVVHHGGWQELDDALRSVGIERAIVVDLTSAPIELAHLHWIRSGWPVVTANKKPVSSTQSVFDELVAGRYRYEATVGAGLPVISTVKDLVDTGDEVIEISAAVSGTLGFLCSECEDGKGFSDAVKEARDKGYTEPDPRDDLSGMDVARKALILARLIGHKGELEQIPVDNLTPLALRDCGLDQFMDGLSAESAEIDKRFAEAKERNVSLRYLMRIEEKGVSVGLNEVGPESPFASLRGAENLFLIRTKRYDSMPLVIRGPGAGAEVTAAGVFSDILRAIRG